MINEKTKPFLLRKENRYLWYILILPAYLLAYFLEERLITNVVLTTDLPIDRLIPYCKYFVLIYVSWFPQLFITGIFLLWKDHEGFKRYMSYIGLSFFTAVIIFAVIPSQQNLRYLCDMSGNDLCTQILRLIHTLDNDMNVFPSLHVVGSWATLFAVFESPKVKKKWPKVFMVVASFMISLSTLFVKQHALLDVLVAVPYSFVFFFLVYRLIFKPYKKSIPRSEETQHHEGL